MAVTGVVVLAGLLYSLRGGQPSFAHYDRRGDVVARTSAAGLVTWQATYEAGGKRTAEFGSTQERQKANTKEEDPTGLLNEGMRYRDLETGTFITRDPAGFVDGPNLYAYVRQNPWSTFDPLGLRDATDEEVSAFSMMERVSKNVEQQAKDGENKSQDLHSQGNELAAKDVLVESRTLYAQAQELKQSIVDIKQLIHDSPDQTHDSKRLRALDAAFHLWVDPNLRGSYTDEGKGGNRTGNDFVGYDKCNIALYDMLVNSHLVNGSDITNDVGHPNSAGSYNRGEKIPGLGSPEKQVWPHEWDENGRKKEGNWSGRPPLPGDIVTYGGIRGDAHASLSLGNGWHIGASGIGGARAFGQNAGININTDTFEHWANEGWYNQRMVRSPQ